MKFIIYRGRKKKKKKKSEKYKYIKQSLGEGAFGEVILGMTEQGEFIAVKKINMENDQYESTARREYEILKKAAHPNIVKVMHYSFQKGIFFFFFFFFFLREVRGKYGRRANPRNQRSLCYMSVR